MEPDPNQRKGTVVRVKAVKTGAWPSSATSSYFVFPEGNDAYKLPVVSIATDSLNLFGHDEGIYVPGRTHRTGDHATGNYVQRGEEWERPGYLEFFDETGNPVWSQGLGLRIHGGFTRRFPQKSLRLYARNIYGDNRFNYPVFPDQPYDSYNRLILRNSGNDFGFTMFMDAAAQALLSHLNLDIQAYRPTVVFINGEYWGIHNFRERFDQHYLERVYGLDPDNVDILTYATTAKEGSNSHYVSMRNFIVNRDMSDPANFEEIKTRMDVENYLDYYSAQIYYGNSDWPHNNIDFWRYSVPYNPDAPKGLDGRWRWFLYDVDRSLGYSTDATFDMIEWIIAERSPVNNQIWPNQLFRNLLENQTFFESLVNTISDHLNTAFSAERVSAVIDSLKAPLEPEIGEHISRWRNHGSERNWNNWVQRMHHYANDRPDYLRQHIKDHWPVGNDAPLTVDVSNPDRGYVQINRTDLLPSTPGISGEPYPWTGIYFSEIPVTLTVHEHFGLRFSHWEAGDEHFYQKEISINTGEISHITAVFEERLISEIEPYPVSEGLYLFSEWDENEPADTFPQSMGFVFMSESDPGLDAGVSGLTFGAYNHDSRTRINGLGEDGFAFINTSNPDGNPGYPGTRLGGAILALDTRNISGVEVGFEAGTVRPNSRAYNLRLQYRIGSEGDFQDLLDEYGEPVKYLRNEKEGHSEFIGPVALPGDVIGQERVELLWRYYHTGEQLDEDSGQRTKLNISAIHITEPTESPVLEPHHLTNNPYEFHSWPADAEPGTAPPQMTFVYMQQTEPGLDSEILGYSFGAFDLDSRTRINGLGEDGFAFINTSNLDGNPGYPGRRLGGAILALNSEDQASISVEWTGGTVLPNSRVYHVRLQYRTGPDDPFRDVLDSWGDPAEYRRHEQAGHSAQLGPVLLPPDAEDQPNLELFWRYYYTGEQVDEENNQRAKLSISSIRVESQPLLGAPTGPPQEFRLFQNYPNPFYPHTTIRYDLPSDQNVRIDLYTIDGRFIATVEEGQARAGRHSVHVDASGYASGVYLYQFTSDDFSETGKMVVIK